ncbi:H-2 class II histocompatibility antigen, A-Q alpha chain-like [Hoplias malabaricus]|uniref:H-2 class II histocompatibility antigen, A-Q alpha chain-like n=1 Tax=Hoplias malabaricus TaxID=27720 RepID=UPI003461861E
MKLCLILVCAALLSAEAKVMHRGIGLTLCSEAVREVVYGIDGDEVYHIDFNKMKGVKTLPEFGDDYIYPGDYEGSVQNMEICKSHLDYWVKHDRTSRETMDAPQSSIYSKEDVELDSKNTLICHITGFYPPHIQVSWTRNNMNVTDGVSLGSYYPNTDGTFNLISTLSFTPEEGDIYSCSVQHTALDRPLTRIWDVQGSLPGVGASVFCGVGLAGGLLGVAVGTFFLIKGNNCN